MGTVIYFLIHILQSAGNFWTSGGTGTLLRKILLHGVDVVIISCQVRVVVTPVSCL
jgi:hypothetical protein